MPTEALCERANTSKGVSLSSQCSEQTAPEHLFQGQYGENSNNLTEWSRASAPSGRSGGSERGAFSASTLIALNWLLPAGSRTARALQGSLHQSDNVWRRIVGPCLAPPLSQSSPPSRGIQLPFQAGDFSVSTYLFPSRPCCGGGLARELGQEQGRFCVLRRGCVLALG